MPYQIQTHVHQIHTYTHTPHTHTHTYTHTHHTHTHTPHTTHTTHTHIPHTHTHTPHTPHTYPTHIHIFSLKNYFVNSMQCLYCNFWMVIILNYYFENLNDHYSCFSLFNIFYKYLYFFLLFLKHKKSTTNINIRKILYIRPIYRVVFTAKIQFSHPPKPSGWGFSL
jgi:hypothetical protein